MIHPDDYIGGTRLAVRRAEIERAAIVGLLRSRRRGMASAEAAGVTKEDFDQPDLRAMFVAIAETRWQPVLDTLQAVRFLLRHEGHWDESVPRGSRGMHWSSATLAEAATGDMDYAAAMLPALFDELKQIVAVWQREAA